MGTSDQERITRELLEKSREAFKERMKHVRYAPYETAPQDRLLVQMGVYLEVLKAL